MAKTIEWPPGSGRRAAYDDTELELMAGFRKQLDAGEITGPAFVAQVSVIHELKVCFPGGLLT